MLRKTVIFLNGTPGSGKDTLTELFQKTHDSSQSISSIECVRELLQISPTDKDPETRRILADTGKYLEERRHFRSKQTASKAVDYLELPGNTIFIHVRERYMAERITTYIRKYSQAALRIGYVYLVRDYDPESISNDSDKETVEVVQEYLRWPADSRFLQFETDGIIWDRVHVPYGKNILMYQNTGTLEELQQFASVLPRLITNLWT